MPTGAYSLGKGVYKIPLVILYQFAEFIFSTLLFVSDQYGCLTVDQSRYDGDELMERFGLFQVIITSFSNVQVPDLILPFLVQRRILEDLH